MSDQAAPATDLSSTTLRLLGYCRERNWAGYDPYDALNSRLIERLPFLNHRPVRLGLTQIIKRTPVNLRPLLAVPPTQNPKAIALFLAALVKLSRRGLWGEPDVLGSLVDLLAASRSRGISARGWGYSFPWQTRTIIVPRAAPNLVCTSFAAQALWDAHEHTGRPECLSMALEGADFLLHELFWQGDGAAAGFGYPLPSLRSNIHNANFLGAALLGRAHRQTGDPKYLAPALRAARYSASRQNADGSWYYGELPTQRWVDNFHTGYNLLALRDLGRYLGIDEFEPAVRKGFEFYRNHFFRDDGAPRYFHDRDFPVDAHCVAQSLLTLIGLKDLAADQARLVRGVISWAMSHLWDERGYFYYQARRFYTSKISYMRWSQAWMALALSAVWAEQE